MTKRKKTHPIKRASSDLNVKSEWGIGILVGAFALISCIGVIIYIQTFHSSFHMDDMFFIVNNPNIHSFETWRKFGEGIISDHSRYAVFFTFAINYALSRTDTFSYHVFNFIIHLFSVLGAWVFSYLLLKTPKLNNCMESDKEKVLFGFFVAFIFCVHPLQTQAISYISQRFESMCSLFYLWAIVAYLKARLSDNKSEQFVMYLGSVLSAGISVLSKEIAITIPVMVVFLEIFCLSKKESFLKSCVEFIQKHWWVFIVFGAMAVFIVSRFGFNILGQLFNEKQSESHVGDILTFPTYLMTQLRVFVLFFKLFFVPIGQNLDYDFRMSYSLFQPITTLLSLLVWIGVGWGAWFCRNRKPLITFGIMFFFIVLSANLIPRRHVIFEHKMYLPLFGLAMASLSYIWGLKFSPKVKFIILSVILAIFSLMTFQRNKVWINDLNLWKDVVKKTPDKYRPNINLGKSYLEFNDLDRALPYLNKAIKLNPNGIEALNNRGLIFHKKGNIEAALKDFTAALRIKADNVEVLNNRAVLYKDLGRLDEALRDYNLVLQRWFHYPEVYNNRGVVLRKLKKYDEARADFAKALSLRSAYPDAFINRGNLHRDLGEKDKALEDYNKAIELNPNNAIYYLNRANVWIDLGNHQNALVDFNRAVQLAPGNPQAWFFRGLLQQNIGDYDQAMANYRKAIQIDPKHIAANNNLAVVFHKTGQNQMAVNQALKTISINNKIPSAYNLLVSSCLNLSGLEQCAPYIAEAEKNNIQLDPSIMQHINLLQSN